MRRAREINEALRAAGENSDTELDARLKLGLAHLHPKMIDEGVRWVRQQLRQEGVKEGHDMMRMAGGLFPGSTNADVDLGDGKYVPLHLATIDHLERAHRAASKKASKACRERDDIRDRIEEFRPYMPAGRVFADGLEAYRADHPEIDVA